MGRTPDFFPGQRLEESIRFLSGTSLPSEPGVMAYVSGANAVSGSGLYLSEEGVSVGPFRKLISSESHARLRQLIHLADTDGPFEGFSGAVKDTDTGVFSTGSIWFTDSGRTKKIIDKSVTRTGILPTEIVWNVYDLDGLTILNTAIDTITYSGVFENSRTRAIISGTPSEYENVKLWWDVNDLVLGSSNVTIRDRSLNGNNGTLVGSPNVSDGFGTMSRRMLTLNGSSQYLTGDGAGSIPSGDDIPFTVAVVCRFVTNPASYFGIAAFDRSSSATSFLELLKIGTVNGALISYKRGDVTSLVQSIGSATNTSAMVLIWQHTGTTVNLWRNGALEINASSNNTGTTTLDNFSIGVTRRGGSNLYYANIEVCEVIVWNSVINSDSVDSEYLRLSTKWSI